MVLQSCIQNVIYVELQKYCQNVLKVSKVIVFFMHYDSYSVFITNKYM